MGTVLPPRDHGETGHRLGEQADPQPLPQELLALGSWLLGAPVGGILNLVPTPCRGPHLISSSMASSCSCSIRARVCASERLPGETVSVGPVGPLGPSSSTSETSGSLSKAGAAAGARTPGSGHGSQSLAEKEEGAVRNPAGAAAGTSPGSASGVRSCGPRRPLGAESAL